MEEVEVVLVLVVLVPVKPQRPRCSAVTASPVLRVVDARISRHSEEVEAARRQRRAPFNTAVVEPPALEHLVELAVEPVGGENHPGDDEPIDTQYTHGV